MEKTLLALTFLILNSLLCFAAQLPNSVIDIDGNPLRTATLYYILPVERGFEGGVTRGLADIPNGGCPLTAVQAVQEVNPGVPVFFTPANPKLEEVIRVSTDLNIRFRGDYTICMQTGVWTLHYGMRLKEEPYVIETKGKEGNPGNETYWNWFKIEEYESNYKLVFCPTVCKSCGQPKCESFGIYIDRAEYGTRRLVLNDKPLKVFFKKA